MKTNINPLRGDIWLVDLDPVVGHEQGKKRPCLVISANKFNRSHAELVMLIPITSKDKKILWHVMITPPEGGLKTKSFVMCEQVGTFSKERFSGTLMGTIDADTLDQVEQRLRILLEL